MEFLLIDTPFGPMGLEGNADAVTRLLLPNQLPAARSCGESPVLRRAEQQLTEYFSGGRRAFDLPLCPTGTAFQRQVWQALEAIPWGGTRTYGALAESLRNPRLARAVGGACHRNPIPILIPCHRVVGSGGSLTGFAGGLALKERLLLLERAPQ